MKHMNDIERAINWLRKEKSYRKEHGPTGYINLAISALENQLSDGWIPVSERLPSEEECNKFDVEHPNYRSFLCTIKISNYEPQTRVLFLSKIFGWKYETEDYNKYVIAWQPLPEPYKVEKDE